MNSWAQGEGQPGLGYIMWREDGAAGPIANNIGPERAEAVRAQLDDSFARAVETIVATLKARGKIVVIGIGKSGNVGAKIAATLTSTGSTSVVLNSVDALHGDLGIIADGEKPERSRPKLVKSDLH